MILSSIILLLQDKASRLWIFGTLFSQPHRDKLCSMMIALMAPGFATTDVEGTPQVMTEQQMQSRAGISVANEGSAVK